MSLYGYEVTLSDMAIEMGVDPYEDYEPIEREPLEQNKHWCFLCLKIWFDHFPVKRDVCVHCHYEIDEVMGLNPPF